jgi:hypothetical protein
MVAWKRALEAGQRPENQVEDPEGEGYETSALLPEKWWQGRGHWKQVRDQNTRWKTPKKTEMRPVLCYLRNCDWKGGTESKADTRNQVEDPEGE